MAHLGYGAGQMIVLRILSLLVQTGTHQWVCLLTTPSFSPLAINLNSVSGRMERGVVLS